MFPGDPVKFVRRTGGSSVEDVSKCLNQHTSRCINPQTSTEPFDPTNADCVAVTHDRNQLVFHAANCAWSSSSARSSPPAEMPSVVPLGAGPTANAQGNSDRHHHCAGQLLISIKVRTFPQHPRTKAHSEVRCPAVDHAQAAKTDRGNRLIQHLAIT